MVPTRHGLCPAMALVMAAVLLALSACQGQEKARPGPSVAAPRGSNPGPRSAAASGQPQMRILEFSIDASGIKLERSTLANGRVKTPPFSVATRQLEFEVFDARGSTIYRGALDHPLRREAEIQNPRAPDSPRRVALQRPNWVFLIRLPAELEGVRVAFFELVPHAGGPPTRRDLGVVLLPTARQRK